MSSEGRRSETNPSPARDMGLRQSTSGMNREMVEWRLAERISSVLTRKVRHWCLEFRGRRKDSEAGVPGWGTPVASERTP